MHSDTTSYRVDLFDYTLIGAAVRSADFVNQITLLTIHDASGVFVPFGPYGGSGGTSGVTFGEIQAFYGRSESGINQIGFKGILYGHSS